MEKASKKPYAKPGIVFEDFRTGELKGSPELIEKIMALKLQENEEKYCPMKDSGFPALSGAESDTGYKEKRKMDIFEKLKNAVGCDYISDLSFDPHRTKAKALLKAMEIEKCSVAELNDLADYFYGKHFDSADAAIGFLKG